MRKPKTYFDLINEKFQRFEDGSVRLPTKVYDPDTRSTRNPIPFKGKKKK